MEKQLIDEAFYVECKKYGLWQSHHPDGKGIITALTEDQCVTATRWYLKCLQEGFEETKTYSSEVGGKL